MATDFLTKEEIEKIVTEKLIEFAQHDRDSDIHFAVWHAGHGLDGDCDLPGSIVTRAVKAIAEEYGNRIAVPEDADDDQYGYGGKPDGYLYDLIYGNEIISANGAVIVDIAGRQFVITERYDVGTDNRIKIQELIPPIEFDKGDGAPIYTSRADMQTVLANLVAALDNFTPAVCGEGIQSAVIIDIEGRQFVMTERYDGFPDNRTKIQELNPPIEFDKGDGAPIYTSRVDLRDVLANLVAALDNFTPAICDDGIQSIEASGLHDDSLADFLKAGFSEADYRRSNTSHALDVVRGTFDNKVAAALEAAREALK